jgi:hypothetical protein
MIVMVVIAVIISLVLLNCKAYARCASCNLSSPSSFSAAAAVLLKPPLQRRRRLPTARAAT